MIRNAGLLIIVLLPAFCYPVTASQLYDSFHHPELLSISWEDDGNHSRDRVSELNARGIRHDENGEFIEALQAYQEAVSIDSGSAAVWSNMGVTLRKMERYEEAVDAFDRAISIELDEAIIWNGRGVALSGLGDNSEELISYSRAVELDPGFSWAWSNLGAVLNRMGRSEEAIRACLNATSIDPHFPAAWYNLGNAYGNAGKYHEAIIAYQTALEVDPTLIQASIMIQKTSSLIMQNRTADSRISCEN